MTGQSDAPDAGTKTVTLDSAVRVDGEDVREIALRCPKAGELRGLMLGQLVNLETGAMLRLLPRITRPPLSEAQLAAMTPADFMALAGEAVLFFVPERQRAELIETMAR
ncbi:MAG: phage tail assembly protein [Rhodospirillales bacterium]|nr:phage tail assembly protein [Rhodospirillales bacterium]